MGLDCSLTPSLLSFGTMPHSSAPRRRVISVQNNSPLTAKLSWRATVRDLQRVCVWLGVGIRIDTAMCSGLSAAPMYCSVVGR